MPKFLYRPLFTVFLLSICLLSLGGQRLFAQENLLFGSKRYVTRFLYTPSPNWGLPLVQVRLNGTQLATFLLDTGCSFCCITAELAQKMNLKTAPANMSDGTPLKINGTEMQAVDEQRLQLGNEEITTPFVVVQQAQIGFVPGVQLDGVIGFTALMDKALLLDPILHQVTLWSYSPSAAEREALHIQDAISCQAFVKNSTLWVQMRLNDKVTTDVFLDTGANNVMLPIEVIKQLDPLPAGKKEVESSYQTFFGPVKTKTRIVRQVEILNASGSGLKFLDCPIQYGPETLTFYNSHLGMNVLQQFYTLMDFIQKRVYFKPTTEESKFKVGIEVESNEDGKLIITGTTSGSSAREAGILAGDEIIEINGKRMPLTVQELQKAFNQPEGAHLTLKIQRKGEHKPREFKLTFKKLPEKSA